MKWTTRFINRASFAGGSVWCSVLVALSHHASLLVAGRHNDPRHTACNGCRPLPTVIQTNLSFNRLGAGFISGMLPGSRLVVESHSDRDDLRCLRTPTITQRNKLLPRSNIGTAFSPPAQKRSAKEFLAHIFLRAFMSNREAPEAPCYFEVERHSLAIGGGRTSGTLWGRKWCQDCPARSAGTSRNVTVLGYAIQCENSTSDIERQQADPSHGKIKDIVYTANTHLTRLLNDDISSSALSEYCSTFR